jgi:hypothetical protein
MRFVSPQRICTWIFPVSHAAAVEAELARLGDPYVRCDAVYAWNGGTAPAFRYEFRTNDPSAMQAAFERLRAAGIDGMGHSVVQSPMDGGLTF